MDNEETMVEENFDDVPADDTLEESGIEETDESEDLESLDGGEQEQPEDETPKEQGTGSEPGWIRKRVDKAVAKAVAETEARMQAMFDQQMAPIRERLLNEEAQELVRNGTVKDIETAKELVRYRQGIPQATNEEPARTQQKRSANGQFASRNEDEAAVTARIDMLTHQADRIKASGGPDVIAEFRNNKKIQEKVKAGEMDFYDVAEQMRSPKRKPPSPMRSPNGASGQTPNAIDSMSDEQFKRLEKRISEGARYKLS